MNSPRELAQRIAKLERMSASGRYGQLGHSSFEGGGINQYSADGSTLIGRYGDQWDGTGGVATFNGPPPPVPAWGYDPVTPGLRAATVRWGGEWDPLDANPPIVAPMNFSHVEVHASDDPAFTGLLATTKKAEIVSARGGETIVSLLPGVPTYFRLVARNTAGQASVASDVIGPFTALDVADYGSGTTVFYGPDEPVTDKPDLWLKETSAGPPPQYETYRWNPDTSAWELLKDQGSADALASAIAAQTAAASKAKIFNQSDEPVWTGDADSAVWFDSDAGNAPYRWDGAAFVPMLLGNGAIQPASLIASDLFVTGSITAGLLESILVLVTTLVGGDPAGEHATFDSGGVRAFVVGDDGIPAQVSWFGHGMGVVDPNTGDTVGGINEQGVVSGSSLDILDGDPMFGGTPLSAMLWGQSWGVAAYAKYPATGSPSTTTNTEAPFLELAFTAKEARVYAIFVEGIEPIALTANGAWELRVRYTSDGSTPTTASTLIRKFPHANTVDNAWNDAFPYFILHNGNDAGGGDRYDRLLFSYAAASGAQGVAINRVKDIYIWVMDLGPKIAETGDVLSGSTSSGGTTTKTNKSWEAPATWQRTWNQAGSVIYDDEMHQGYGDSFNGIRKSCAGWVGIPAEVASSTITSMKIYMESYWWWNMSGGTLYCGMFTQASQLEPASWPAATNIFTTAFTARTQGRWIDVPASWRTALLAGGWRGISLTAPSTDATYYGKFKGQAYGRPRLRIEYTI